MGGATRRVKTSAWCYKPSGELTGNFSCPEVSLLFCFVFKIWLQVNSTTVRVDSSIARSRFNPLCPQSVFHLCVLPWAHDHLKFRADDSVTLFPHDCDRLLGMWSANGMNITGLELFVSPYVSVTLNMNSLSMTKLRRQAFILQMSLIV